MGVEREDVVLRRPLQRHRKRRVEEKYEKKSQYRDLSHGIPLFERQ
jgi:hypothetical protein